MADSTQPASVLEAKKAKKAEYLRRYNQQNKERIKEQQRQYRERNKEQIKVRGKAYRESNKDKIRIKRKNSREANKDKISQQRKLRYRENSEAIKKRVRDYRLQDVLGYRSRHRSQQKKWRASNKDRVRAIYRRHMKKKRREDASFDLKCKCRERIAHALRKTNSSKSKRTIELIGCTAVELMSHIESLFLPGMTWENRGRHGWHIDHIIPLAKFDLRDAEQQAAAFHYTNLQPLWAEDNLRKSDKVAGQHLIGFAYAAKIAESVGKASSKRPKRARRHKPD